MVDVPEQALGGFHWVGIDFGSYIALFKSHVSVPKAYRPYLMYMQSGENASKFVSNRTE